MERGAVLQASGCWDDITERHAVTALSRGTVEQGWEHSGSFITAYDACDIAVTGAGVTDGGGRFYALEDLGPIYRMPITRPFTLFLLRCANVTLRETTYRDGALWTVRLTGCEDVLVHGLRIRGDMKMPNADGLDLDRCRRVRVSECSIVTPDYAISLKTCEEFPDLGPCEDIMVTGCVLETRSSALVIGGDATAPIRNVVFGSCVMRNSHRGLSVNLGQDSHYENIVFSNMVVETRVDDPAWGAGRADLRLGVPVAVRAWHGSQRPVRERAGALREGVHVSAERLGSVSDVLLENVRLELDSWIGVAGGQVDRRPYSGVPTLEERPISGFLLERIADVTVRHCEVTWGAVRPDYVAHALEAVDVDGLRVEGLRGDAKSPDRLAAVVGLASRATLALERLDP